MSALTCSLRSCVRFVRASSRPARRRTVRCGWAASVPPLCTSLVRMASAGAGTGAGAGAGASPGGTSAPVSSVTVSAGGKATQSVSRPPRFEDLDVDARRAWLGGIDTFLVDCDGVMWRGTVAIPGSADAIAYLRGAGKRVVFVTNNSTKSRDQYVKRMRSFGVEVTEADIMSTAYCTAAYLRRKGVKKKVYMMGAAGLKKELESEGFTVLGLDHAKKDFAFGSHSKADFVDPDLGAVVIGSDMELNYFKLAHASTYLRYNPGCLFVSTNPDQTYPDGDLILPGGGCIAAYVATALGRGPDVLIGKPTSVMLDQLEADLGLDMSRAAMIGDRLNTDVAFGNSRCGHTLLVMSGVTQPEDLDTIPSPDQRPTYAADSIAALNLGDA